MPTIEVKFAPRSKVFAVFDQHHHRRKNGVAVTAGPLEVTSVRQNLDGRNFYNLRGGIFAEEVMESDIFETQPEAQAEADKRNAHEG